MHQPLLRVPSADPGARTGGIAPCGPPVSVTLRFAACPDRIRDALHRMRQHLAMHGLCNDRLGTIELVLAEALNNIAEHAYDGQANGPVWLNAHSDHDRLRVVLRDRGRAMPGHALPGAHLPDIDGAPETLPEGGFGWFLIRDLSDAVDYARVGATNRLILQFSPD